MRKDVKVLKLDPRLALLGLASVLLLVLLLFAATHDSRLAIWPRWWTNDWFILTAALIIISGVVLARFRLAGPDVVSNLTPTVRLVLVFGLTMWLAPGAYLVWVYPFTWWIYGVHVAIALTFAGYILLPKARNADPAPRITRPT
ncbi:MAG TPA: hypothetical protein VF992_09090 [Thermoplasmata archaeon]